MNELEVSEHIARGAHGHRKDLLTGQDYIRHVERVVGMVDGEQMKAAAWLHGVTWDGRLKLQDLVDAGISPEVVAAVDILTRRVSESYFGHMNRIRVSGNPIAVIVKRAALQDRLNWYCPEIRRRRYLASLGCLEVVEPALGRLSGLVVGGKRDDQ